VGADADMTAGALVPWICDALLSNHSGKREFRGHHTQLRREQFLLVLDQAAYDLVRRVTIITRREL